jgi:hypothetical protein
MVLAMTHFQPPLLAGAALNTLNTLNTRGTPMPTAYELMEAYRAWWRTSYSTSPNTQAVILAAAWAEHVLSTYRAGEDATPPPEATT